MLERNYLKQARARAIGVYKNEKILIAGGMVFIIQTNLYAVKFITYSQMSGSS